MALVLYTGPTEFTVVNEEFERRFVGLDNQGATCYLNSTLQTLFMTPQFREAIFKWQYNPEVDESPESCIPYQLQLLFAKMQANAERSLPTVDLTTSFSWGRTEATQQQDIQELIKILFDRLEEAMKGTPQENVINQVFGGTLANYIRCINVEYESVNRETFLDLLLTVPIKPKITDETILTECIESFLMPEVLDGENQYYVETLQSKQDAIKGCRLESLPSILTIQLKRFVFDMQTCVMKKVNNIVKFPMVLDMNKYVASTSKSPNDPTINMFENFLSKQIKGLLDARKGEHEAQPEDSSIDDLPDLVDSFGEKSPDQLLEEAEAIDGNVNKRYLSYCPSEDILMQLVEEKGEWIYELYSVIVHMGAIYGGHYFVLIKDLTTKQWFEFNDSTVTEISESVVTDAWGRCRTYYSTELDNRNAYMLMYKKVRKRGEPESKFPETNEIPSYIMEKVEEYKSSIETRRLEEVRRKEEIELQRRESLLKCNKTIHIFDANTHKSIEQVYSGLDIGALPREVLEKLWVEWKLYEDIRFADVLKDHGNAPLPPPFPENRMRFCDINAYYKVVTRVYPDDMRMDMMSTSIAIDIRWPDEPWGDVGPPSQNCVISVYDPNSKSFVHRKNILFHSKSLDELNRSVMAMYPWLSFNESSLCLFYGIRGKISIVTSPFSNYEYGIEIFAVEDKYADEALSILKYQFGAILMYISYLQNEKQYEINRCWSVPKLKEAILANVLHRSDIPLDKIHLTYNSKVLEDHDVLDNFMAYGKLSVQIGQKPPPGYQIATVYEVKHTGWQGNPFHQRLHNLVHLDVSSKSHDMKVTVNSMDDTNSPITTEDSTSAIKGHHYNVRMNQIAADEAETNSEASYDGDVPATIRTDNNHNNNDNNININSNSNSTNNVNKYCVKSEDVEITMKDGSDTDDSIAVVGADDYVNDHDGFDDEDDVFPIVEATLIDDDHTAFAVQELNVVSAIPMAITSDISNNNNNNNNNNSNALDDAIFFAQIKIENSFHVSLFERTAMNWDDVFIPISVYNATMDATRIMIHNKLVESGRLPDSTSPARIRLYHIENSNISRIFIDGVKLSEQKVYLAPESVYFEVLDIDEDTSPLTCKRFYTMVAVRRWNKTTWKLEPVTFFVCSEDEWMCEVLNNIAMVYGIDPANARYFLTNDRLDNMLCDCPNLQWNQSSFYNRSIRSEKSLLICDSTELLRELTDEERHQINLTKGIDSFAIFSDLTDANTNTVHSIPLKLDAISARNSSRGVMIKSKKDKNTKSQEKEDSINTQSSPSSMLFGDIN